MVTVTSAPAKPPSSDQIAELKAACRRYGITQDEVAEEAGVTRPLVVRVLGGHKRSANVVETARRLVADAEKRLARARARKRRADGDWA